MSGNGGVMGSLSEVALALVVDDNEASLSNVGNSGVVAVGAGGCVAVAVVSI